MFEEKDRLIFKYKVGGEERFADPITVRRTLIRASAGEIFAWSDETIAAPPGTPYDAQAELAREEARDRVVACCREAFDLPAVSIYNGEGVTEAEVWAIYNSWSAFWSGEKKPAGK